MNEIQNFIKSFTSTARERILVISLFYVLLVLFDVIQGQALVWLSPILLVYVVQMYLVNKSLQLHFQEDSTLQNRVDQALEVLDAVSVFLCSVAFLTTLYLMVFI